MDIVFTAVLSDLSASHILMIYLEHLELADVATDDNWLTFELLADADMMKIRVDDPDTNCCQMILLLSVPKVVSGLHGCTLPDLGFL